MTLSLCELLKQQFLKSTVPALNLPFSARWDPKSPYDFHFYLCFSKPNEFNNYISISQIHFRISRFLQFKYNIYFLKKSVISYRLIEIFDIFWTGVLCQADVLQIYFPTHILSSHLRCLLMKRKI